MPAMRDGLPHIPCPQARQLGFFETMSASALKGNIREDDMKRAFAVLCMAALMVAGLSGQEKTGSYEPRKGDVGIMTVLQIHPGMFGEYSRLFLERMLPAAARDSLVRDSYSMVSEDGSEVIVLMLQHSETGEVAPLPPLPEAIAGGRVKSQSSGNFNVMVAFNEGFYPIAGDKAVVITRHIKEGMFEAAKAYLENSMIASLASDLYQRYYIVLEQERTNTLIAFSLIRGEVVSDPRVVAIRESGFSRFMAQPFEMKTYTFFAIIEE
jgi:hypothetical protein